MLIYLIFILSFLLFTQSQLINRKTKILKDINNQLYFIQIQIGTPPITHSFTLDTTSSMLSLNCLYCGYCTLQDLSPYNSQLSSTLINVTCGDNQPYCLNCLLSPKDNRCQYHQIINKNQSKGYYIKDHTKMVPLLDKEEPQNQITFQKITSPIKCVQQSSKQIITHGILGLSPDSFNVYPSIYSRNIKDNHQFSICYSQNGGMFYLGKVNSSLIISSINLQFKYIGGYYKFNLTDVSVGGIKFNINTNIDKVVSIDSTIYNSVFPIHYYNKLISILTQVCNSIDCQIIQKNGLSCFYLQNNQINRFPNISIILNQQKIDWDPTSYLIKQNKTYCIPIQKGSTFTLGVSWMINRLMIFNIQSKTIKILNSNCQDQTFVVSDQQDNQQLQQMILGLSFETLSLCIILMILVGIILGILFKRYWKRRYMENIIKQAVGESKPAIDLVEQNAEDIQLQEKQNPSVPIIE